MVRFVVREATGTLLEEEKKVIVNSFGIALVASGRWDTAERGNLCHRQHLSSELLEARFI